MNIFNGMSKSKIATVILGGTAIAFVLALIISAVVSLLPITDNAKTITFFALGFVSFSVGYLVLISIPEKTHEARDAANSHATWGELKRLFNDIKRNLSQNPVTPQSPITESKTPRTISIIAIITFIFTPIIHLIKRIISKVGKCEQLRFSRTGGIVHPLPFLATWCR